MRISGAFGEDYDLQAVLFGSYLLHGVDITPDIKTLYAKTIQQSETSGLTASDQRIFSFAINHPWSIGLLDAGCAVTKPEAELRRRLYILFAILEANTDYWEHFLPKKRTLWYTLVIIITGIRGVVKAGVGAVLVKVVA